MLLIHRKIKLYNWCFDQNFNSEAYFSAYAFQIFYEAYIQYEPTYLHAF